MIVSNAFNSLIGAYVRIQGKVLGSLVMYEPVREAEPSTVLTMYILNKTT